MSEDKGSLEAEQGFESEDSKVEPASTQKAEIKNDSQFEKDKAENKPAESESSALNSNVDQKQDKREEKLSNMANSVGSAKNSSNKSKKPTLAILFLVCLLLLVVSTASYFLYRGHQRNALQNEQISQAEIRLNELDRDIGTKLGKLSETLGAKQDEIESLKNRVAVSEQRLAAQQKRILSMSTTSRDDWLLAEAEYLLKLANQRVLIERKADSASALFEEADAILRDLGDPDLFALREVIKQDLVSLKLAQTIDVEGIYLELSALASKVDQLPLVPEAFAFQAESNASNKDTNSDLGKDQSVFEKFLDSFSAHFRIIDHEDRPAAILPPEETAYLHLNLRMLLEQAQLALLREQQNIYENSLAEALSWVKQYFPNSEAAHQYELALSDLKTKQVVNELPDVSQSLELLNAYISDLHKLGSSERRVKAKQDSELTKQEAL